MKDPEDLLIKPEITCDDFIFGIINKMMDGYRKTHIFIEALAIDIFNIAQDPVSSDDLAGLLSLDPPITRMFCDCLVDMALLTKDGDHYINSDISNNFLVRDSPLYQGANVGRSIDRVLMWEDLEYILADGARTINRSEKFGRDWITAIAQGAMGGGISSILKHIESHIDMSSLNSLLDLGGGHGLYTIAFCHRYPNIQGTVFDMPGITDVTCENIKEYGSDVKVITGDYYKDGIGGPYDLIFTSFNNACSDPALAEKIADAVNPGGYLVIRRHRKEMGNDPCINLEWNFEVTDLSLVGKPRHAAHIMGSEEYDRIMEGKGLKVISNEIHDDTSRLIILHKAA